MVITTQAPRAQYKSVQPVPGVDLATLSIWGNQLAYAATQGMSFSYIFNSSAAEIYAKHKKSLCSFFLWIEWDMKQLSTINISLAKG